MALWNTDKESIKETTSLGGGAITTNGAYDMTIRDAYIRKANNSQSTGVCFNFNSEDGYASATIWFVRKDGTPNPYGERELNKLFYLLKLDPNKLTTENRELWGAQVEYFPAAEGKEIGVCLLAEPYIGQDEKERFNYNIGGTYLIGQKKTADELANNQPATFVDKFIKKYSDRPQDRIQRQPERTTQVDDDEEFPF